MTETETETERADWLSLEQELDSLLPLVAPAHLPAKLSRVAEVIGAIMSPLLPLQDKQTYLLDQFREWAPADELEVALKLLNDKKEQIMTR